MENKVVFNLNMYFIAIGWNFLSIVWEGLAPPFLFDELHRKTFSLPKTVQIVSLLLIRLSFVETPSLAREAEFVNHLSPWRINQFDKRDVEGAVPYEREIF